MNFAEPPPTNIIQVQQISSAEKTDNTQKTYGHVTNMPMSDSEESKEEINFYSEGLSNHATSYVPS